MHPSRAFWTPALTATVALSACSLAFSFCYPARMPAQHATSQHRTDTIHTSTNNPNAMLQLQYSRVQRDRHRCLTRHCAASRRGRRCQQNIVLSMIFDPDVTPTELDAFHAWLDKAGVNVGDQLALAGRSPLDGTRGLVTTKPIENGKQVLAVPQGMGLTAKSLGSSSIARYVKGFEGWTGDTGLIALQLLWERAQGEKSRIAAWINVLPRLDELDIPLFWNEEELALADASSTRGISGFGADVDEDYAWLAENAFDKNPKVFAADKFGPTDFRWAVGVALSRSFFVDGELRLTPLVDFVNHASSRSMLEPTGGMTGLFGSKAVVLRAGRNYEEGEEFFVSYGPKGAAGYLEENGFVPPLSGSELTCELEFSLTEDDRFFDDKEDILQLQGLGTSATFDLTSVGLPDAELIRFLRLSFIGGEDAFLLESIFRNEVWDFMAEPVSRGNEEAVNNALASRCRTERESLYGTAEEEEDILSGKKEATPRQRLCATVRRGERLALKMTEGWCDNDSKALDRKEYYQERRLKDLQLDLPYEVDDVYPLDQQVGRQRRDMDW